MIVTETRITVNASIDSIDTLILGIFQRFPSLSLRVRTLIDILEYEGIFMNYAQLRDRLRRLVILGLVCRHRGKRTDHYSIPHEDHEEEGIGKIKAHFDAYSDPALYFRMSDPLPYFRFPFL